MITMVNWAPQPTMGAPGSLEAEAPASLPDPEVYWFQVPGGRGGGRPAAAQTASPSTSPSPGTPGSARAAASWQP